MRTSIDSTTHNIMIIIITSYIPENYVQFQTKQLINFTDIEESTCIFVLPSYQTIDINLNLRSNNEFSCGINRIEGINSLCDLLENEEFVDTEEDDFIELKKQLFKTVFSHFANRPARGMWMCSTNIAENNEDYQT